MKKLSIVAPFLNEEIGIRDYLIFADNSSKNKPYEIEIILVDDGSKDNSVKIINDFDFTYVSSVKIVKLSKNFGSHAATRAGFLHATGDYCTFVGVDLQEPPDMIDTMYDALLQGYDAVYIEKGETAVGFFEKAFSHTYSALIRKFAVPNYGSGGINNIMFNRKILGYLNQNIESNSSSGLQIINAGFNHTTITMDYKQRIAGESKWTFSKKIKLFIDSFVAFSYAPLRFVSIVGFSFSAIGLIYAVYILISYFANPSTPVPGFATTTIVLLLGFGLTNISLGIIAEYLWRAYDAARGRPPFIISDVQEIHTERDDESC